MTIFHKTLQYQTKGKFDFRDITEEAVDFVKQSKVKNGIINIQSLHTTATVYVNENEPLLIEDMKKNLEKLAPEKGIEYQHDDFKIRTVNMCEDECANGHSHCKTLYLPTNVALNIKGGKIIFGTWQRIMFVELDRSRPRKISLQIIGE